MLRQPFGVLRDGEPIHLIPLRNAIRTGIIINDARTDLGMISEYEEREAAVFSGQSWDDWLRCDMREREAQVAYMRMHYQISNHTSDAVSREQERRQKRASAKGKR